MLRPRDAQRQKVYDWENQALRNIVLDRQLEQHSSSADGSSMPRFSYKDGGLTQAQVIRLTKRVAKTYGTPPPRVRFPNTGRNATAKPGEVSLPPWACSLETVLHEMAHVISFHRFGWNKVAGHGPEFVRIYTRLLKRFMKLDEATMLRSLRERRIKVAPKSVARTRRQLENRGMGLAEWEEG